MKWNNLKRAIYVEKLKYRHCDVNDRREKVNCEGFGV